MIQLSQLSLADIVLAASLIRQLGDGAAQLGEVADRIVRYFYDDLRAHGAEEPDLVLARLYKTFRYEELDEVRRHAAREAMGGEVREQTPCLTLLASAGVEPTWGSPADSRRHKAIPIASEQTLARLPMVAKLMADLGIDVRALIEGRETHATDAEGYRVFFVAEALGSPFVPVQRDFVVPYGVRSVLGFGGVLPGGSLFVVLLFSKVPLHVESKDLFRTIALAARIALLPFANDPIGRAVAGGSGPSVPAPPARDTEALREHVAALTQLLQVHERVSIEQALSMQALIEDLERRNQALEEMRSTIHDLSTPILEVWDEIVVLPVIGLVDSRRSADMMAKLLAAVVTKQARFVIIDITGVDVIDTATAERFVKLSRAVNLLGAQCVLTGMRAGVAQMLSSLDLEDGKLDTYGTLKQGLHACLRLAAEEKLAAKKVRSPLGG